MGSISRGRIYNKGEVPFDDKKYGPGKYSRYFYLKIGRIMDLDYDRHKILIEWVSGSTGSRWLPLSMPYAGPAGAIGCFPEIGAIAIFGFYDKSLRDADPLLLSYLPAGLSEGLNANSVRETPNSVPNEDGSETQYQFRRLRPGDMIVKSPAGGNVFLNKHVSISDSMQDSIVLRSSDQAIMMTSLHNFIFAEGASVSAGPAIRNKFNIYDENGNRIPGTNARESTLPDGRQHVYIVPYGKAVDYSTQYYSEYRIEADDLVDGNLDTNDINSETAVSYRKSVMTLTMGNYIGADHEDSMYGHILRPVLFNGTSDTKGQFSLVQAVQTSQLDEPVVLGMAYALHSTQTNFFIGVDKEGHYYMNLPASVNNPLGGGRSMSILAQGNRKEIWGSDSDTANSWDMTLKGGLKWRVGAHNVKGDGRGVDISTTGSMYVEVQGEDTAGFAKQEVLMGNSNNYVDGSETGYVTGSSIKTIIGLKQERVQGAVDLGYQSDFTMNVTGVSSEIALKEKQCKFAKRKTTITAGDDALEIIKGNLTENLTLGSRKATVKVGNIEETVITGSRKATVTTGKYNVTVATGSMKLNVAAGTAKIGSSISTTLSGMTVAASGNMVKLGKSPLKGGIVTGGALPSHFDYCTGAPLKGSFAVTSA